MNLFFHLSIFQHQLLELLLGNNLVFKLGVLLQQIFQALGHLLGIYSLLSKV